MMSKMNDIHTTEENSRASNVQMSSRDNSTIENNTLTVAQKARIERNRQTALLLKQARLIPHPYAKM